uniref:DNA-directed RNA polymerase II subunit RPB7 n=2 Tax=Octactis speculum TaxID=3111310 RepID=A0A7S2HLJ0_9STRA|mmetsp:Transcript_7443/g.9236  ORF Transcript_7443/g.9236 Transcript_7443/m.9236 type:complete len:178 (+) Transcript_7443:252-785(+)|eukprot:CAMPEP_0185778580 /NCGR_PEP_ID=MMETSP1174-20130828/92906_1 /TAXON_ID=35687 /ORGANISM="Dictyocha speculum, Strain CCMP1381" /LENGTH=177 /DNA_ID=CAMNT_0028467349 /DNA_START=238 /DNA_END=771 /DNA_ORIENTATION=-
MFFYKKLRHEVLISPEYLGPKLKQTIRRRLIDEIEGSCINKIGYVVCVTDINDTTDIEAGLIEYETGHTSFMVTYGAVLFRPFKNEVLDATVTTVNQLGFFCKAGPLQVFVSRYNLPGDIREGFDPNQDMWVSEDGEVEIKRGCVVRLRIMGLAMEASKINAVGNMRDDFLGVIELP